MKNGHNKCVDTERPVMTGRSVLIMKKKIIPIITIVLLIIFFLFRDIEHKRIDSPNGLYYVVISYRLYNSLMPIMPGGSNDKSGFATMYNSDGHLLGTLPIPMLSMASDIVWENDTASIKLIGEWNFSNKTISYWNGSQTKLIVKYFD